MIIGLCLLSSVVFFGLALWLVNYGKYIDWLTDPLAVCSAMISLGLLIFTIGMSVNAIYVNIHQEAFIATNEQVYDSLVYQLENNIYDNDNDLGKKELYNQIQNWNSDLAEGKALQNDFWVGVFYADVYDDFKYIELE